MGSWDKEYVSEIKYKDLHYNNNANYETQLLWMKLG